MNSLTTVAFGGCTANSSNQHVRDKYEEKLPKTEAKKVVDTLAPLRPHYISNFSEVTWTWLDISFCSWK